jgi:2-keto-4-pentenoate hydratase
MPSHQDLAARLRAAYTTGAVPPLRDGLAPDDAAGAYAIQALNTAHWQAEGRRISGRKIGLTAKAVQAQLGVSQPDFGVLFTDMEIPDGGSLDPAHTLQPKVEAEVALILAHPLNNPNATLEDIIAATAYAVPALEIVDSRIADWKISFADTVADNGSSAFYVLGTEPKKLDGLDLYTCGMAMTVNGEIVSLGAGAACLGHPLNAALWLVRTLAGFGDGLRAGDVILTGALGPMVALKPGDTVEAQVGGLGRCGFRMGTAQ